MKSQFVKFPTYLAVSLVALLLVANVQGGFRRHRFRINGCSIASAAPQEKKISTDWPCWRGPDHNGISRETEWNAQWPKDGPRKLWSVNVGTGFSSVAVADGKLFTLGHSGDEDTVWCLDATTGHKIWEHKYKAPLVDNLHEGGPAATPTIDEDRVYTLSKDGLLHCLDLKTGAVRWTQELQKLLGVEMPVWGHSCSPLVYGDWIILDGGRTAALDKKTGKLIWQTALYRPGYGSPTLMEDKQGPLVAVLNNDFLMLLRANDGSEVDKVKWETDFVTSSNTPIVEGNSVYVSTGYDKGCALYELKDGKLTKQYANRKMCNHMCTCVLWQGTLYGFDGNSHDRRNATLTAMDYKTGEVKWKQNGLGCGSLMMADGKLVILSDDGELITAEANPKEFKPISRFKVLTGKCWTVPVLSGGKIFCRTASGNLQALDVGSESSKTASNDAVNHPAAR